MHCRPMKARHVSSSARRRIALWLADPELCSIIISRSIIKVSKKASLIAGREEFKDLCMLIWHQGRGGAVVSLVVCTSLWVWSNCASVHRLTRSVCLALLVLADSDITCKVQQGLVNSGSNLCSRCSSRWCLQERISTRRMVLNLVAIQVHLLLC